MLTLRAHVALAARCTRRLFPALALADDRDLATLCDTGIVMAEAFALGEPGPHARARSIARALLKRTISGDDPRRQAALEAAKQTALTAEHAFSAVTRTPPATPCAWAAHKAADGAITTFARSSLSQDDRALLNGNYKRDFNALMGMQRFGAAGSKLDERQRDLGPPVDISRHGVLGALWADDPRLSAPDWFTEGAARWRDRFNNPRPVVVGVGEDYEGPEPDFLVFDPAVGLDDVRKRIDEIVADWEKRRDFPPAFFVYAPGIPERDRVEFALAGAIVDDGGPDGILRHKPHDLASLKQELSDWFAEADSDWTLTRQGAIYQGAWATWRMDMCPRLLEPPPEAGVETAEDLAPSESYEKLVDFLNGRSSDDIDD